MRMYVRICLPADVDVDVFGAVDVHVYVCAYLHMYTNSPCIIPCIHVCIYVYLLSHYLKIPPFKHATLGCICRNDGIQRISSSTESVAVAETPAARASVRQGIVNQSSLHLGPPNFKAAWNVESYKVLLEALT